MQYAAADRQSWFVPDSDRTGWLKLGVRVKQLLAAHRRRSCRRLQFGSELTDMCCLVWWEGVGDPVKHANCPPNQAGVDRLRNCCGLDRFLGEFDDVVEQPV
jgi:hypothetical protein